MIGKKNVLGRGLGALIEDAQTQRTELNVNNQILIDNIEVNPFQPRSTFDEEAILSLAESIKVYGVIQPITVRKINENKFQLISGERRFRASKLAGLDEIPAYVREADDQGMLEMALVENIQREDLDAIEISLSYSRLIDECKLTQEKLSDRVGKQRSTITNYLRLLKLPAEIQMGIKQRKISMGHARALINVEDPETQIMIFHEILRYDFSVRKVEDIVRELSNETPKKSTKRSKVTSEVKKTKEMISKKMECKADIKKNLEGKGRIILFFDNENEYEKLITKLNKK